MVSNSYILNAYKRMYCYHGHNFIYSIHQYAGDSGIYETKL